jgi:hypothetical protein
VKREPTGGEGGAWVGLVGSLMGRKLKGRRREVCTGEERSGYDSEAG